MPRIPTVAIIGRPNTGKSTLFNRLAGSRRALVSEVPGTTRDHVATIIETPELNYLLVDTGGIGGGSEDKELEDDVSAQSVIALESADLILFTINAREEITGSDRTVTDILRKRRQRHVPVILTITKCEDPSLFEDQLHEYHALGIGEDIVPVSAQHNIGLQELEEAIAKHLQALHFVKEPQSAEESSMPRIAIIGKPNVGKSSLINALMAEPQLKASPRLVSEIPGTTRDVSDTIVRAGGKEYLFVDTAGLRRKTKIDSPLEQLSAMKSIQAMQNADIVVLLLDASEPISRQEKRIAGLALEASKGIILLVNKIDLLKKDEKEMKRTEIAAILPFCRFAPVIFASAKTREGLLKMFPLLDTVFANRMRRIPTKDLHRWYEHAIGSIPSQALASGKHLTQAKDPPPTFVLFVRDPKAVTVSQLRALENNIRSTFAFEGTPIRWVTKGK